MNIYLLFLGGLAAAAITIVSFITFSSTNEKENKPAIVKITSSSPQARVLNLFNSRFAKMETHNDIIWKKDEGSASEEDIFVTLGIVKEKDKQKVRKGLIQDGYKRYQSTCKQISDNKHEWSAGYCYTTEIGINEPKS